MSKRLTKNEMPRTMLGVLGPKQILVSDMVGAAERSVRRVPSGKVVHPIRIPEGEDSFQERADVCRCGP